MGKGMALGKKTIVDIGSPLDRKGYAILSVGSGGSFLLENTIVNSTCRFSCVVDRLDVEEKVIAGAFPARKLIRNTIVCSAGAMTGIEDGAVLKRVAYPVWCPQMHDTVFHVFAGAAYLLDALILRSGIGCLHGQRYQCFPKR